MPVYEYHCTECERQFDRVESMQEHEERASARKCPFCGGERVESRLSAFFAKTDRKS